MQLALICDDPLILSWLDALQGDCGHDVVLAVVLTPSAAAVLRGRTGIQLTNRWEDLLLARQIDAVIVGGRRPVNRCCFCRIPCRDRRSCMS